MHINGRLELDSADGIGLNIRNGGFIQIGANSEIKGASGTAVRIAGSHASPLTAAASTTLNAATVTAQTLWNATGSSLILKLEGAAKWNLNADSTLKNMELAGNAELRVDGDYSLTPLPAKA